MKLVAGYLLLVAIGLAGCARTVPPERFSPPAGFIERSSPAGVRVWTDRASGETLTEAIMPHIENAVLHPGEKRTTLIVCANINADISERVRGRQAVLRFEEPWHGRYRVFRYSRPKGRRASRAVMYALTTSCPP